MMLFGIESRSRDGVGNVHAGMATTPPEGGVGLACAGTVLVADGWAAGPGVFVTTEPTGVAVAVGVTGWPPRAHAG